MAKLNENVFVAKDFSVSASIFPAEVLTLGAPRTTFAPLFSFREQQALSRIIEIKHLHEEDKLIKAKHNTTLPGTIHEHIKVQELVGEKYYYNSM